MTRLWHAAWVSADPHGERALNPGDAALIAETCVRSEVLWLRPLDAERAQAAWHVWHDDAVCVVYGVGEQVLPLLTGRVEVLARSKETGGRLVRFVAVAEQLTPRTPAWDAAADVLSAHRLNTPDPARQRDRWASGCLVTLLRPAWLVESGWGGTGTPSGALPPPGGPATTVGRRPFHLGRRTRRAANG
jgi:hypothetical protein